MEANLLRIVLFGVGLLILLGIYLWDRHKRNKRRMEEIRQARAEKDGLDDPYGSSAMDIGDLDTEAPFDVDKELDHLSRSMDGGEAAGPATEREGRAKKRPWWLGGGKEKSSGEAVEEERAEDEKPAIISPEEGVPTKIIQINLVARDDHFEGNDILRAAKDIELVLGPMDIFHRFPGGQRRGRAMFSVANMVEPGVFPVNGMADFKTPGLILFAQLPGPYDGIALFTDILFTAERLATLLNGELQDETHSALGKQTIEHIREGILEHRRQVQLLRKKR